MENLYFRSFKTEGIKRNTQYVIYIHFDPPLHIHSSLAYKKNIKNKSTFKSPETKSPDTKSLSPDLNIVSSNKFILALRDFGLFFCGVYCPNWDFFCSTFNFYNLSLSLQRKPITSIVYKGVVFCIQTPWVVKYITTTIWQSTNCISLKSCSQYQIETSSQQN